MLVLLVRTRQWYKSINIVSVISIQPCLLLESSRLVLKNDTVVPSVKRFGRSHSYTSILSNAMGVLPFSNDFMDATYVKKQGVVIIKVNPRLTKNASLCANCL